ILRFVFWEQIEPIGVALGIALLVIKFVMAIYVIPTGSMQPTLRGGNDYGTGDKVLVNKFIYRFEPIRRWDVIVFEFPYPIVHCSQCGYEERGRYGAAEQPALGPGAGCANCGSSRKLEYLSKDYIKRCIGLPGDEIEIADGNILIKSGGRMVFLRKTEEAQAELWVNLFAAARGRKEVSFDKYWKIRGGGAALGNGWPTETGREMQLDYAQPSGIRAHGDKGPGGTPPGALPELVGDVLLEVDLDRAGAKGELALRIRWNRQMLEARFQLAEARVSLFLQGEVLISSEPIPADALRFSLARVDGRAEIRAGSQSLFAELPLTGDSYTLSIEPSLSYSGESVGISDLRLARDVYYTSELRGEVFAKGPSYTVPPGHYFAMGDNSPYSSDSRDWGYVPDPKMIGRALCVLMPFGRIKLIH
ncbi:MAG: hypothetical protein HQL31_13935, partial [Planctomycetes bacterium]|nr:hypothetical protein [Planctomycetota bacterium]